MYHTNKNNAVLTQERPSPRFLWGRFRILSYCTDSIKGVILNRCLYLWAVPRSVFIRGLVNYRIQDLVVQPFKAVRFQIKFGMTTLFHKGAFSLIELLVVVLIIGILAAIALPQYQKAVAKVKFQQLGMLGTAIGQSLNRYYLEHGFYTTDFNDLDLAFSGQISSYENTHGTVSNLYHPFGTCTLRSYASMSPFCHATDKHVPEFILNLSPTRAPIRKCNATSGDKIAVAVCQQLTADPNPVGNVFYFQ